jgi:putative heme iron utilization protein
MAAALTRENKVETPKQEALRRARALLAAGGTATLSVLDVAGGAPFGTLVNVAADSGSRPLLLISALAHHSKCLAADPRASLLLQEPVSAQGDPMLTYRLTLQGVLAPVSNAEAAVPFLARHPYAELYAGFGDFSFWRMEPESAHIIAGFGRAYGARFKDIATA